mmetsp:Transcript_29286/g.76776  ORF Transcript_29286/g.76776 Transcript_29286/m.76776 type:complete len:90 (-) Transcript_29286:265-534(-)
MLLHGDGRLGHPSGAPYSVIHVGAAAPKIPAVLLDQLAPGGRIVIPVGPEGGSQSLDQVDKAADGSVTRTSLFGVRYVSLTDRHNPYYT